MNRTVSVLVAGLALGSLTACADKVDESQSTNFTVAATDDACTVSGAEATTGTSTFEVTNNGEKTTEFYVYTSGGRVVGEVENIGPGATRKLVVQITDPGDYTLTCKPGMVGDGFSQTLKVTGEAVEASTDEVLTQAVDGYISYVRSQTTALQGQVDEFVAAIESDDIDTAKELFPLARTPYERIEPVAESFPNDLDPRIDLREADIQEGDTWSGFHKIEKDLWVNKKITDETKADAAQLKQDIAELVDGVAADDYTLAPVQIASGAQGLLDEIATSKITGEEDIFSHTDLYDFQANLDGSRAAIASLEKALNERDPQLLTDINERFDAVQTLLDTYREGDGFVSYDKVSQDERRKLSDALDVLTEKVSTVQEVVAS
ncbi:Imelysin [Corynebacterium sp. CMW7794]|uniref:iron uptake system protein EfeO n=1 Tax=Corynebacterium TaxID=1716 RepID=UPI000796BFEB|nr:MULTISPECIES: iron uptake system protein EfeO [Corynebacterium]KXB53694.1 Imelysin [Corynebacterium sp. DNF00584]KXI19632.1 Imelysin [Corynebacterium sp. CMW7794]MBF9010324.1 peptidase M75 family protein [Corynebacterium phoceense]MCQ9330265.1 EfeM/EfeO family lipoprotein [Corynebacterium phoceense]MCQ9340030.1 EfeM/EfeO family lipoprotein [Corynebacterium phoceense]